MGSWFAISGDLSKRQQSILKIGSFLVPIILWCAVSYLPFLWHPDIKIQISADRDDSPIVYISGDRLPRYKDAPDDFTFDDFVEAIRQKNKKIRQAREAEKPLVRSRRTNMKVIKHLAPVALEEGWIHHDQVSDTAVIYKVWGDIAGGMKPEKFQLSEENLNIIRENWRRLEALSPIYNSKKLPKETLLSLVPQGVPSNPVFVPSPHEVVEQGWRDWTSEPAPDKPSMKDRYWHSLWIVFGGFLLSCAIGIPVGVLSGIYSFFSKLFEPFIDFFRYMPAPAFGTVLVAVFSVYDTPKIVLVFVGTFFQMVLVIANTTRQADKALLEAAQTLGARSKHIIFRVIIPGIMPNLYNDLRILLGWSWTWLVIAELIGTKSGLTEFIETQGRFRNFDSVYPTIILIGITGFFTDQFLSSLRPIFFPWKAEESGQRPVFFVRFFLWLIDRKPYVKVTSNQHANGIID